MIPARSRKSARLERDRSAQVVQALLFLLTLAFWLPHEDGFNISKFSLFLFLGLNLLAGLFFWVKCFSYRDKLFLSSVIFFCICLLISLFSSQNLYKSLFGNAGRYTGAITYLCGLIVLLFFASRGRSVRIAIETVWVLAVLGSIQMTYGWIQFLDLDPIGWVIPYGSIIGTLGNANFVGSFISLGSIATLWIVMFSNSKSVLKVVFFMLLILQQVLIIFSNVRQGSLVFLVGALVLLIWKVKSNRRVFILAGGTSLLMLFGVVLGILQKGPLDFLYKSSISIRGDYWRAAIRIFQDYPIQGIGLGNFGDFFASYRDIEQVERSGIGVLADSAHNLPLDLLVSGGVPLLLAHASILVVVAVSTLKRWKSLPESNKNGVIALGAIYIGYLAQSLITVESVIMIAWSSLILGSIYALTRVETSEARRQVSFSTMGVLIALTITVLVVRPMWVANSLIKEAQSIRLASNTQENRVERLKLVTEAVSITPFDAFYSQAAARILLSAGQSEGEAFARNALRLNKRDLRSASFLLYYNLQIDNQEKIREYSELVLQLDPLASEYLND